MSATETVFIVLSAALAGGVTVQEKDTNRPWYDAWWKAACSTIAIAFLISMFQLLSLKTAFVASGCGAFLGLLWQQSVKRNKS